MNITVLDRYLAKRIIRPFLATIAIVIMLLSLENSARLMSQLDEVEQPLGVLLRLMGYLLPEYLGMGILFAVFIGVALAFRGLALSGELDVISAIGISPLRLMRTPLVLAFIGALLLLATRGYFEPWGERQLDALGLAVKAGELGMAIQADEFYSPSSDVMFHADSIDQTTKSFSGVMVKFDKMTVFAKSGVAINHGQRGILLILDKGQALMADSQDRVRLTVFARMQLQLTNDSPLSKPATTRQSNARRSLPVLYQIATSPNPSPENADARAGLGGKIVIAMAVPLLPLLALGLSVPPKRQASAIGIGLGMVILVGFVQVAHALEERASTAALLQFALLWVLLAVISISVWRYHNANGPGQLEAKLNRLAGPGLTFIGRVLKIPG